MHLPSLSFLDGVASTQFSAFLETAHVGTGSQRDILAIQPNQLGNPQTGLDREQDEGSIATTAEQLRDSR